MGHVAKVDALRIVTRAAYTMDSVGVHLLHTASNSPANSIPKCALPMSQRPPENINAVALAVRLPETAAQSQLAPPPVALDNWPRGRVTYAPSGPRR